MTGPDPEDFTGYDRFLIQGRLGEGGFGVVYRALDRERNAVVALKTLRHVAAKSLVRFKQEFRALADVSHPNLVTLYELSSHEHQWFFTMELVDGVDFLWYVRGETYPVQSGPTSMLSSWLTPQPGRSCAHTHDGTETGSVVEAAPDYGEAETPPLSTANVDRLRRALPQLVEGVLALHDAGKLHRDIKPSNVLVTREGRVVLLDFGLVEEIGPELTHTLDPAGTPAYMSPEQVAGLPLTQASDWYNVGTMIYQALTGQLPFSGTAQQIMRLKQECEAAPPRDLAPRVPLDLDELCRDLLRRDPAARPTGREVLRALMGASVAGSLTGSVPSVLPRPALFVGREQHLEALRDAFLRVKTGRAVTVAVHGRSGMGKSVLVRRFLGELKDLHGEVVVLTGRCYERESVPYKALDALVDALSRYLRRLPSAQAEALLPHDILALARVFPVLRQVGAVNRARRAVLDIPDSLEVRRRAFRALRELLVRVADRRPLVLFIDDLHWGDVDSASLLEELLRPPEPPALLLIGCYRSEEAESSPLLKTILPKRMAAHDALEMRDIVVGELSDSEAHGLARALIGGGPEESDTRAEAIARESRGNPYFIEELVRFSRPDADAAQGANATFDEVIAARVSRLSAPTQRLLEVVAVSGLPIELGVAYQAAEVENEKESVLASLRAAHLVRMRSTPGRQEVETLHDRIREAVTARLSAESLKKCHHRLASALFATGGADPEMLATHYLGAGDTERAGECATSAAVNASEALAFDRAAALYRLAIKLGVNAPAEKAKLEVRLGDALANAGRGAEAAEAYLSAAKQAGPALAIDFHRRAAEQLLMSGHVEDGLRALNAVLAQLDMKMPKSHREALLSLLFRRAQIRLRGLWFRERVEGEVPAQDLLRIDACYTVSVGMSLLDQVRGADFQARHLLLALRAGEPYRVARALAMEGVYVAMGRNRNRQGAERLLRASRVLSERGNQPYAVGFGTLLAGQVALVDGKWRDAHILCERAVEILRERCTGVVWETLVAQVFSLGSLFFLGEVAELLRRLPSLLKDAEERGNLLAATLLRIGFWAHVAWLAGDEPDRAREELQAALAAWSRSSFDYLQLWVRGTRTDIALYSGEGLLDLDRVGERWRSFARSLDRFNRLGFIRGLDSRARRRIALAALSKSARDRENLLGGAEGHARTILREKTRWGDPLAHLIQAAAAATRGEAERTVDLLTSAEADFAAADMALFVAVARRRRGELLGGEVGRGLVDAADAWMNGQSIKNPQRMSAMLAPGRWSAA